MYKVTFFNPHNFKIDKDQIKSVIISVFQKQDISQNTETSIAIVNDAEMYNYAVNYMGEKGNIARSHPVLSFLKDEVKHDFIYPPDNKNHIGEIIISYDKARQYSIKSGKSIDQEIANLAEHAALHLCGVHHD